MRLENYNTNIILMPTLVKLNLKTATQSEKETNSAFFMHEFAINRHNLHYY